MIHWSQDVSLLEPQLIMWWKLEANVQFACGTTTGKIDITQPLFKSVACLCNAWTWQLFILANRWGLWTGGPPSINIDFYNQIFDLFLFFLNQKTNITVRDFFFWVVLQIKTLRYFPSILLKVIRSVQFILSPVLLSHISCQCVKIQWSPQFITIYKHLSF